MIKFTNSIVPRKEVIDDFQFLTFDNECEIELFTLWDESVRLLAEDDQYQDSQQSTTIKSTTAAVPSPHNGNTKPRNSQLDLTTSNLIFNNLSYNGNINCDGQTIPVAFQSQQSVNANDLCEIKETFWLNNRRLPTIAIRSRVNEFREDRKVTPNYLYLKKRREIICNNLEAITKIKTKHVFFALRAIKFSEEHQCLSTDDQLYTFNPVIMESLIEARLSSLKNRECPNESRTENNEALSSTIIPRIPDFVFLRPQERHMYDGIWSSRKKRREYLSGTRIPSPSCSVTPPPVLTPQFSFAPGTIVADENSMNQRKNHYNKVINSVKAVKAVRMKRDKNMLTDGNLDSPKRKISGKTIKLAIKSARQVKSEKAVKAAKAKIVKSAKDKANQSLKYKSYKSDKDKGIRTKAVNKRGNKKRSGGSNLIGDKKPALRQGSRISTSVYAKTPARRKGRPMSMTHESSDDDDDFMSASSSFSSPPLRVMPEIDLSSNETDISIESNFLSPLLSLPKKTQKFNNTKEMKKFNQTSSSIDIDHKQAKAIKNTKKSKAKENGALVLPPSTLKEKVVKSRIDEYFTGFESKEDQEKTKPRKLGRPRKKTTEVDGISKVEKNEVKLKNRYYKKTKAKDEESMLSPVASGSKAEVSLRKNAKIEKDSKLDKCKKMKNKDDCRKSKNMIEKSRISKTDVDSKKSSTKKLSNKSEKSKINDKSEKPRKYSKVDKSDKSEKLVKKPGKLGRKGTKIDTNIAKKQPAARQRKYKLDKTSNVLLSEDNDFKNNLLMRSSMKSFPSPPMLSPAICYPRTLDITASTSEPTLRYSNDLMKPLEIHISNSMNFTPNLLSSRSRSSSRGQQLTLASPASTSSSTTTQSRQSPINLLTTIPASTTSVKQSKQLPQLPIIMRKQSSSSSPIYQLPSPTAHNQNNYTNHNSNKNAVGENGIRQTHNNTQISSIIQTYSVQKSPKIGTTHQKNKNSKNVLAVVSNESKDQRLFDQDRVMQHDSTELSDDGDDDGDNELEMMERDIQSLIGQRTK